MAIPTPAFDIATLPALCVDLDGTLVKSDTLHDSALAVARHHPRALLKIPGWLLSTGTLRILALLACLRHPDPPPLLVVEEIENDLDPRTIHLLVEEFRAAIAAKKTQIVVTTHSPYLVDLMEPEDIVLVSKRNGATEFHRPQSGDELRNELGDKVRRRAQELQQQNEGAFGGSSRSQMPVT